MTEKNKISEEHENCKIQFFDMKDDFKELHLPIKIWSTANFYRLRLPDLLKDVKKIIYLDTDTLIYKDLSKLYNYNIEGKYFIGMLEFKGKKFIKRYKINNFINTGVMLCNLEEIKKGNIANKIINYIKKNNNNLEFPVNEPTNLMSHKKNGYFRPEDVIIGFCTENDHYIMIIKPWLGLSNKNKFLCIDPFIRFYEAARKTSYFYEILKTFPINITHFL